MKTDFMAWPSIFVAVIVAATFSLAGCSESTSQKDVTKAQQKMDKAQANTQDAMQQGQRDVAAAERENNRPYTVNKPVTPEDATATNQNIADAQHSANEKVADAKEK